jgi:hypothetical protein
MTLLSSHVDHVEPHIDVASYVLGVLDDDDNEAFETHLVGCVTCQHELRSLYELPNILDEVRGPKVRKRVVVSLLGQVADARRRRRARLQLAVAAAAVMVLVAPVATVALRPAPPDPRRAPVSTVTKLPQPAEKLQGRNRAKRLTARIAVVPKEWGTHVALELTGITGPADCELVAVARTGDTVITGWLVPAGQGFGVPGSPDPLRVEGATALARTQISSFEVRTKAGLTLIKVPA